MARYPKACRNAAADSWVIAHQELSSTAPEPSHRQIMQRAVEVLRQRYHGRLPPRTWRYIAKWAARREEAHSVHDAPRGRKTRLTDSDAQAAVEVLLAGYTRNGQRQPFQNIAEALRLSAALRRVQQRCKLSARTLWKRLVKFDRRLVLRAIRIRPPLSDQQRQARKEGAAWLAAKIEADPDYLKRVFWIDAKKFWIRPRRRKVICNADSPHDYLSMPGISWRKQDQRYVHYYAAVNWFVGAVIYVEVSGTKDLDTGYKARRLRAYHGVYTGATSLHWAIALSRHSPQHSSSWSCTRTTLYPLRMASASQSASRCNLLPAPLSCCIKRTCESPSWHTKMPLCPLVGSTTSIGLVLPSHKCTCPANTSFG